MVVVLFVVGDGGRRHSGVLSSTGRPFSRSNDLIVGDVCMRVHFSVSMNVVCASRARYRTMSLGHDM